jgi:hypothetical protein
MSHNIIDGLREAMEIASRFPVGPKTKNGIIYIAKEYGFYSLNERKLDLKKYKKYIKFINSNYTMQQIAKAVDMVHGAIAVTVYKHFTDINGELHYGKIYYTKKDRDRIVRYFQDKKRNSEKTH